MPPVDLAAGGLDGSATRETDRAMDGAQPEAPGAEQRRAYKPLVPYNGQEPLASASTAASPRAARAGARPCPPKHEATAERPTDS